MDFDFGAFEPASINEQPPPFNPERWADGEEWLNWCYENGFYWAGDKEMQWSDKEGKYLNPNYDWKSHGRKESQSQT